MTETGNTTITADEATREHERCALMAVAVHIFEYALDVPHSIALDRYGPNSGSIAISVHRESAEAWVNSIAVDSDDAAPAKNTDLFGKPMTRHVVAGRLPDLGIRVSVRYFETAPVVEGTHLTVVS